MKNTKTKPDLTDVVAETLLITLAMKCRETRHPKSIFHDPKSCEILERLDYDFCKFKNGILSAAGVILRAKNFDKKVQRFIVANNNPVVVLIGCGLDTRYHRIYEKNDAVFYELDLPEVIALREKLLPQERNQLFLARSMFDTDWMQELKSKHSNANFIFVIEGVLMYFKKEEVKTFITNLAKHFPKSALHFDALSQWMSKRTASHDTVSKTKAKFKWGVDNPKDIESWADNLVFKNECYFSIEEKGRWKWLRRLFKTIPIMKKAARNLEFEIQ